MNNKVPGCFCSWDGAWMFLYMGGYLDVADLGGCLVVAVPRVVSGCYCTWEGA